MLLENQSIKSNQIPHKSFIVNVVDDCNLCCTHCYTSDRFNTKTRMSLDTVRIFFSRLKDNLDVKEVTIIWHGGEPLLVKPDFYKAIIEYEKKFEKETGIKISNDIQTNGLLLNEEHLNVFREGNFGIGISFEGPSDIHNKIRVDKQKRGTYDLLLEKLDLLNKYLRFWGVVTTVTRYHLNNEARIYEEYKIVGVPAVRFNPFIPAGRGSENELELSISPDEYYNFLVNLYDIWVKDANPVEITTLSELVELVVTGHSKVCHFNTKACSNEFLTVVPNGEVFHCNRFGGVEDQKLGNILEDTLQELTDKKYKMVKDVTGEVPITGRGCLFESYRKGNIRAPSPMTFIYARAIDYIKADLKKRGVKIN